MTVIAKAAKLLPLLILSLYCPHPYTCLAQSFIFANWAVTSNDVLDAPIFDGQGNRLYGASYVAMLYSGPIADSLTPSRYEFNGAVAGPTPLTYLAFGTQPGYFSEPATLLANVGGVAAWLQVRAWDTRLGSSYEEVVAQGIGGYGASDIFYEIGGDPGGGVPTPPGYLTGLQSFSLLPEIPEPNASLLLLVGFAVNALFRGRDKALRFRGEKM